MRVIVAAILLATTTSLFGCPGQTETCARYVDCQAAVDATVDTSPWQQDGRCWALPETARACDAQCGVALEALRQTPSPPAVCADDDADTG